jgi:membrane protein YdbS with pleckstrin-like domain
VTVLELREPVNRVSARARWYWAVRAGTAWAVIVAVQVALWLSARHPGGGHAAVLAGTLVLAVLHLGVMPQWRFRVHRWQSTDTAVYTQSGWFTQERRIAPTARIQTVDTQRGPFEQLFGLSNVTVTTASAAGPLKIHGLDRRVAEELVHDLTVRTQRAGGDGT